MLRYLRHRFATLVLIVLFAALLLPPSASAARRPPPAQPGTGPHLVLQASRSELTAGAAETAVLTATLVDAAGQPLPRPDLHVTFLVSDPALGHISPERAILVDGSAAATLSAGTTPGRYWVEARAGGYIASLWFQLKAPVPAEIRLEAAPNSLQAVAGSAATITAYLVDPTGATATNQSESPVEVTLTSSAPEVGTVAQATLQIMPGQSAGKVLFAATDTAGSTVISGSGPFPVVPVTIRTDAVSTASQLRIRPGIAETPADGVSEMTVVVEVLDASGNAVAAAHDVDVALRAELGGGSLDGGMVRTRFGLATFRLRSHTAGTYLLTATAAGLVPATEQARFTASGRTVPAEPPAQPAPPSLQVIPLPAETHDARVTVSGSASVGARVTVTLRDQVVRTSGQFTVALNLNLGPNEIGIMASDLQGMTSEVRMTVVRHPAPPGAILAPGHLTVTAGATQAVPVSLIDTNGEPVTVPVLTGTVDPADLGTYGPGGFAAGTRAGSGTLTVHAGPVSFTLGVTVMPADLATLTVLPTAVVAGQTRQLAARGADRFGNEIVPQNVEWSASAGNISADGRFTAPAEPGSTVTVTARAGSLEATAALQVVAPAVRLELTALGPIELTPDGSSVTVVKARAIDATGQLVAPHEGTVQFTSSDNAALQVLMPQAPLVNGEVVIGLKAGLLPGVVTVTATAEGLETGALEFTVMLRGAFSVSLTPDPPLLSAAAGSTGKLLLTLLDQLGRPLAASPDGPVTVSLTSSNPSVVMFAEGRATQEVVMTEAAATVHLHASPNLGTATIQGSARTHENRALTVTPAVVRTQLTGVPYKLSLEMPSTTRAGVPVTAVVRLVDYMGSQVTTNLGNREILLSLESAAFNGAPMTVVLDAGAGQASLQTTVAGFYQVRAASAGLVGTEATLEVTPGSRAALRLTAEPSTLAANGVATSLLTASIVDIYGNTVPDRVDVTFERTTSGGATQFFPRTAVTTDEHGKASVTVTASVTPAADTFQVAATGLAPASVDVMTRIMGAPYSLHWEETGLSVPAGADATVRLQVRDAMGQTLTYLQGQPVTVTVKDGETVVATGTGATVNGVATVKVAVSKSGTYGLHAESGQLLPPAPATLTVSPSKAVQLLLEADRNPLVADGVSRATITVRLADQHGNTVTAAADRAVYLRSSNTSVLDFEGGKETQGTQTGDVRLIIPAGMARASTIDGVNSLFAKVLPGSATIAAISEDGLSGTLVISSVLAGAPAGLFVPAPADGVAGQRQVFTVNLVDGLGNLITSNSTAPVSLTVVGDYSPALLVEMTGSWVPYTAGQPVVLTKGQVRFAAETNRAGTYTYTVATDAIQGYSREFTHTVLPGAPVTLQVEASAAPLAADGSSVGIVTARILDAYGNVVTAFNGPVTFSVVEQAHLITLLATEVNPVNGIAQIQVQARTEPGEAVIRAEASNGLVGMATIRLVARSQIALESDPPALSASPGSVGTLTIRHLSWGVPTAPAAPLEVTLVSSNPAVITFANGVPWQTVTLSEAHMTVSLYATWNVGSATIAATAGTGTSGGSIEVQTVMTGSPYKLQVDPLSEVKAGTEVTVTLRALDWMGQQVTTPGPGNAALSVVQPDGTTKSLGNVTLNYGVGRVSFLPEQAGTYKLTATLSGMSPATASLIVIHADPAAIRLWADPAELSADGWSTATLTAEIIDAYGNSVDTFAGSVTFHRTSGNSVTLLTTSADAVAGMASVDVQATVIEGTTVFTAAVPQLPAIQSASVTITTQITGVPYQMTFLTPPSGAVAGVETTVRVGVQDALGRNNTGDTGRPVTLTVFRDGQVVETQTAVTAKGVALFRLTLTQLGSVSLVVSSEGLVAPEPATLTVVPGAPASLRLSVDRNPLATGSTGTITVETLDAFGNLTSSSEPRQVRLTSTVWQFEAGPSALNLIIPAGATRVSTVDGVNSLRAPSSQGSTLLSASSDGLPSVLLSVSSVMVGAPYRLSATQPPETPVGEQQVFTVSLVDYNGNALTGDSATKLTLTVNEGAQPTLFVQSGGGWTQVNPGDEITFHKGQITFAVDSSQPGTLTYTLTATPFAGYTITEQATGTFVP